MTWRTFPPVVPDAVAKPDHTIWIARTRFLDLSIGWNLPGAKYNRAKYTSSRRLKTKL